MFKFISGFMLVALLGLSQAASAGAIKDSWYAGFSDSGNKTLASGFSEVTGYDVVFSQGITGNYSQGLADLGRISDASSFSSAMSAVQIGELRGFASSSGVKGEVGSFASFDNGWRDFLTVSGGTGRAKLTIFGHFDGRLTGEHDFLKSKTSAFGTIASNEAGASFVNLYGDVVQSTGCDSAQCNVSIDGSLVRLDYQINIDFEYGEDILLASIGGGFADTGSLGGSSLLDFTATSKVDYFVLPDGAQLHSAGLGDMVFSDGVWRYAATAVAVPEPASWGLLAAGLVLLSWRRPLRNKLIN